jgi:hypothetical protein
MTPTSVFQLGRMRHLDLLAAYFLVAWPGRGGNDVDPMGRPSTGTLVKAVLAAQAGTR